MNNKPKLIISFSGVFFFGLLPCITWGGITWWFGNLISSYSQSIYWPNWLVGYLLFRLKYLLSIIPFLLLLSHFYKLFMPTFYCIHSRLYLKYSILGIFSICIGFLVKNKFWNHILDGCFVSPFIEEVLARFVLYEAHKKERETYIKTSILSSLGFALMHIGYDPSLFTKSTILPLLSFYFLFSLVLCTIFWYKPKLILLIIFHSISNLLGICNRANQLEGAPAWICNVLTHMYEHKT